MTCMHTVNNLIGIILIITYMYTVVPLDPANVSDGGISVREGSYGSYPRETEEGR